MFGLGSLIINQVKPSKTILRNLKYYIIVFIDKRKVFNYYKK